MSSLTRNSEEYYYSLQRQKQPTNNHPHVSHHFQMPSLSSSISSCSTFSSSGMTPDHFRHRHSQSGDQVMIHDRYTHKNNIKQYQKLERSRSAGSNYYYYYYTTDERRRNNNHIALPLSKSPSCPCSPSSSSSSSSSSYPKNNNYYYYEREVEKQRQQKQLQRQQRKDKDDNKPRRVSFNQQVIVIESTILPTTETSPHPLSALIDEGDTKKNGHCLITRTEEIPNEYAGEQEEHNAKKNKWLWDESQLAVELADDMIYDEQNNNNTMRWYKRIVHYDHHHHHHNDLKKKLLIPRLNNMIRHRSTNDNNTSTNQKQQKKNNKWWSRRTLDNNNNNNNNNNNSKTPAALDVPVTPLKPTEDFYNSKNNRHHHHAILLSGTSTTTRLNNTQYSISSSNNSTTTTEDKKQKQKQQSKRPRLNKKPCIQKFTRSFKKLMMGFVI